MLIHVIFESIHNIDDFHKIAHGMDIHIIDFETALRRSAPASARISRWNQSKVIPPQVVDAFKQCPGLTMIEEI